MKDRSMFISAYDRCVFGACGMVSSVFTKKGHDLQVVHGFD